MGYTVWHFLLDDSNEFRRYPATRYELFVLRESPLNEPIGPVVRSANVFLTLRNRKPEEIWRVDFRRFVMDAKGYIEKEHDREVTTAFSTMLESSLFVDRASKVLDMRPYLADRKLDLIHFWEPDKEELRTLAAAVNERARTVICTGQSLDAARFERERPWKK